MIQKYELIAAEYKSKGFLILSLVGCSMKYWFLNSIEIFLNI